MTFFDPELRSLSLAFLDSDLRHFGALQTFRTNLTRALQPSPQTAATGSISCAIQTLLRLTAWLHTRMVEHRDIPSLLDFLAFSII